jgi:hypothetical protein
MEALGSVFILQKHLLLDHCKALAGGGPGQLFEPLLRHTGVSLANVHSCSQRRVGYAGLAVANQLQVDAQH